jgi:hypothetical protein
MMKARTYVAASLLALSLLLALLWGASKSRILAQVAGAPGYLLVLLELEIDRWQAMLIVAAIDWAVIVALVLAAFRFAALLRAQRS